LLVLKAILGGTGLPGPKKKTPHRLRRKTKGRKRYKGGIEDGPVDRVEGGSTSIYKWAKEEGDLSRRNKAVKRI